MATATPIAIDLFCINKLTYTSVPSACRPVNPLRHRSCFCHLKTCPNQNLNQNHHWPESRKIHSRKRIRTRRRRRPFSRRRSRLQQQLNIASPHLWTAQTLQAPSPGAHSAATRHPPSTRGLFSPARRIVCHRRAPTPRRRRRGRLTSESAAPSTWSSPSTSTTRRRR